MIYGPPTFAQELDRQSRAHADYEAQQRLACDLWNACEDDVNEEGFFYQGTPEFASYARNPYIKGTIANE